MDEREIKERATTVKHIGTSIKFLKYISNNTYLLTPWYRVLLEKLTGLQLVNKFPAYLWNPKVHYRTHKRPPTLPILSQPNPVHIPTSHLLEIYPNIIHPSTPRSPQWSLSLRFPHQDHIRPPLLTHTRHMPSPSHSSRFYHPHNIGWAEPIILPLQIILPLRASNHLLLSIPTLGKWSLIRRHVTWSCLLQILTNNLSGTFESRRLRPTTELLSY